MTHTVNVARLLFLAATLLGSGAIAVTAHADPPAHAPAYGYRNRFDQQDDRRINRQDRYTGSTQWNNDNKRSRVDRDSDWNRRISESDRLREQNRQRLQRERFQREMEQRNRRNDRFSNSHSDSRPNNWHRNDRDRYHP